jgi:hypothetical protein
MPSFHRHKLLAPAPRNLPKPLQPRPGVSAPERNGRGCLGFVGLEPISRFSHSDLELLARRCRPSASERFASAVSIVGPPCDRRTSICASLPSRHDSTNARRLTASVPLHNQVPKGPRDVERSRQPKPRGRTLLESWTFFLPFAQRRSNPSRRNNGNIGSPLIRIVTKPGGDIAASTELDAVITSNTRTLLY